MFQRLGVATPRYAVFAILPFVVIAFVPGLVKASQIQTTYYPPFGGSTFFATSSAGIGCGHNDIFASPFAWLSDGKVVMDTGSWALGCGAYAINAWAGFQGLAFTVGTSGTRTITYKWEIWWDASLGSSLCVFGTSYAEGWIKFFGNLWDQTAQAWKLNGDKEAVVWNWAGGCGFNWAGYQNAAVYYVTFSTYLIAGHTYSFYTYLMTHALADAVGFANANSRNNVGTNGDFAYLRYMYVS